jgi:cobalt-zinc-cadmium efflux system membrane fusion protein
MSAPNALTNSKRVMLPAVSSVLKSARYLGILSGLLALGWYGHQTHWTFQSGSHGGEGDHGSGPEKSASAHVAVPGKAESTSEVSDDWKVTFPTENSLALSGITTTKVEERCIAERVRTTGVITYDERLTASLAARTTGTVWQVCKHVGETIRRGDVLVIIDAAEVGRSKAEFLSDLVACEAKAEVLMNLESVGSGAIPQRQVREARVALREAKIQLLNSEQNLVNLGFTLRAEEYESLGDIERAKKIHFLGLPEAMTQELDPEMTTSNLLPIRATFDGVVLKQDVALGETAEVGKPILEIADTRRMWLRLDVPKEDASKLALGQQLTFNPDGIEQDLSASITWISTEMNEQTRTLQVRAEVENPVVSADAESGQEVRLLRANTFGTGTIILKKSPTALVVPVTAVLHDGRQPLVFARTSALTFERVDVELGVRDGKFIEIQSGELKPGAEIVSRGGHVLKSEWTLNHVASAAP